MHVQASVTLAVLLALLSAALAIPVPFDLVKSDTFKSFSGGGPPSSAVAFSFEDLDGDAEPDIIAYYGGNTLDVYLSTLSAGGTAPTAQPVELSVLGGTTGYAPIPTDLDGDGEIDIVTSGTRLVSWMQGDGRGNFSEAKIIFNRDEYTGSSAAVRHVAAERVTRSPLRDIVVMMQRESPLLLRNLGVVSGELMFAEPTVLQGLSSITWPEDMVLFQDVTRDGLVDVLVGKTTKFDTGSFVNATLFVAEGDGTTFNAVPFYSGHIIGDPYAEGEAGLPTIMAVDIGDVDSDGVLDCVAAFGVGYPPLVLRGLISADNTTVRFDPDAPGGLLGPLEDPSADIGHIRVIDVDLDNINDLILFNDLNSTLYWRKGLGGGAFSEPGIIDNFGGSSDYDNVAFLLDLQVQDVDSSGAPDLFYRHTATGVQEYILLTNTQAPLTRPSVRAESITAKASSASVTLSFRSERFCPLHVSIVQQPATGNPSPESMVVASLTRDISVRGQTIEIRAENVLAPSQAYTAFFVCDPNGFVGISPRSRVDFVSLPAANDTFPTFWQVDGTDLSLWRFDDRVLLLDARPAAATLAPFFSTSGHTFSAWPGFPLVPAVMGVWQHELVVHSPSQSSNRTLLIVVRGSVASTRLARRGDTLTELQLARLVPTADDLRDPFLLSSTGNIEFFANHGDGIFRPGVATSEIFNDIAYVVPCHLLGSSAPDLVIAHDIAHDLGNLIHILPRQADDHFVPQDDIIPVSVKGSQVRSLHCFDMNADGYDDIVVLHGSGAAGLVEVLYNEDNAGNFTSRFVPDMASAEPSHRSALCGDEGLAFAGVNGVAFWNASDDNGAVVVAALPSDLLALGHPLDKLLCARMDTTGLFAAFVLSSDSAAPPLYMVDVSTGPGATMRPLNLDGAQATDMAATDLDGDGRVDLLVLTTQGLYAFFNPVHGGISNSQRQLVLPVAGATAIAAGPMYRSLQGDAPLPVVVIAEPATGFGEGSETHVSLIENSFEAAHASQIFSLRVTALSSSQAVVRVAVSRGTTVWFATIESSAYNTSTTGSSLRTDVRSHTEDMMAFALSSDAPAEILVDALAPNTAYTFAATTATSSSVVTVSFSTLSPADDDTLRALETSGTRPGTPTFRFDRRKASAHLSAASFNSTLITVDSTMGVGFALRAEYSDVARVAQLTSHTAQVSLLNESASIVRLDVTVGARAYDVSLKFPGTPFRLVELFLNPTRATSDEGRANLADRDLVFLRLRALRYVHASDLQALVVRGSVQFNLRRIAQQRQSLNVGDEIILVESEPIFRATFVVPSGAVVDEWWGGTLSVEDGAGVALTTLGGDVISSFTFNASAPYASLVNGDGHSVVIDETGALSASPSPYSTLQRHAAVRLGASPQPAAGAWTTLDEAGRVAVQCGRFGTCRFMSGGHIVAADFEDLFNVDGGLHTIASISLGAAENSGVNVTQGFVMLTIDDIRVLSVSWEPESYARPVVRSVFATGLSFESGSTLNVGRLDDDNLDDIVVLTDEAPFLVWFSQVSSDGGVTFVQRGFDEIDFQPVEANNQYRAAPLVLDGSIVYVDSEAVKVMHGDGGGEFLGPEVLLSFDESPAIGLGALDADDDDTLDLVVLESLRVSVAVNDGGTFSVVETISPGTSLLAMGIGDVNGDTIADVILLARDKVIVYTGDGASSFSLLQEVGLVAQLSLGGSTPKPALVVVQDEVGGLDAVVVVDMAEQQFTVLYVEGGMLSSKTLEEVPLDFDGVQNVLALPVHGPRSDLFFASDARVWWVKTALRASSSAVEAGSNAFEVNEPAQALTARSFVSLSSFSACRGFASLEVGMAHSTMQCGAFVWASPILDVLQPVEVIRTLDSDSDGLADWLLVVVNSTVAELVRLNAGIGAAAVNYTMVVNRGDLSVLPSSVLLEALVPDSGEAWVLAVNATSGSEVSAFRSGTRQWHAVFGCADGAPVDAITVGEFGSHSRLLLVACRGEGLVRVLEFDSSSVSFTDELISIDLDLDPSATVEQLISRDFDFDLVPDLGVVVALDAKPSGRQAELVWVRASQQRLEGTGFPEPILELSLDPDSSGKDVVSLVDRTGDDVLDASTRRHGFAGSNAPRQDIASFALDGGNVVTATLVGADVNSTSDLVFSSKTDGRVLWLENLGGAAFSDPHVLMTSLATSKPAVLAAGPVSVGDDSVDVLVASPSAELLVLLSNPGAFGDFESPLDLNAISSENSQYIDVLIVVPGGLGNTGASDVILRGSEPNSVKWLRAREPAEGVGFEVARVGGDVDVAVVCDVDGDSYKDVVTVESRNLAVYKYMPDSRSLVEYDAPAIEVSGMGNSGHALACDVVDPSATVFDLFASTESGVIKRFTRSLVTEAPGVDVVDVASEVYGVLQLILVDLTASGTLDLLVLSADDETIGWYEYLGESSGFGPRRVVSVGNGPTSIAVGLIDDDDVPDVVAVFAETSTLSWFRLPPLAQPDDTSTLSCSPLVANLLSGETEIVCLLTSRRSGVVVPTDSSTFRVTLLGNEEGSVRTSALSPPDRSSTFSFAVSSDFPASVVVSEEVSRTDVAIQFTLPAPEIVSNSLTTVVTGTGVVNSGSVALTSSADTLLQLGVRFLPADADVISISYGPEGQLDLFQCIVTLLDQAADLVQCRTEGGEELPNGVIVPLFFQVTAFGQESEPEDTNSLTLVGSPQISSVRGCEDDLRTGSTHNCPLGGGVLLSVSGTRFGVNGTTSVLIGGKLCRLDTLFNETFLTCSLPPSPGGVALVVAVTVRSGSDGALLYGTPQPLLSFRVPTLESVSGCDANASEPLHLVDCPRAGGSKITIRGSNFADEPRILVGGVACENVSLVTDSGLGSGILSYECVLPPGAQTARDLVVLDVSGQPSENQALVSYTQCEPGLFGVGIECRECDAGRFSAFSSATVCDACEVGKYAGSGARQCELCAAGRFSNTTGLVECFECVAGKSQSGTGGSQCELCDQGRFANATGADVCELCPEGKVTAARGATECEACAPGTVERENRKLCLACSVGSASNDPADDCELCAPGRFSNMTGLVECFECAEGTSQPAAGGGQCELCDQGRFANTTGADVCELCPEGKVTAARGATECEACAPGTVERENRKLCLACSVGSASNDPADDCELCAAGRFSNMTGLVECFECAEGTSQPAAGGGQCELCDQGRFANTTGADVCELCPEGKVTAARGATECEACAPGTVERENRKLCLACSVGSASNDPADDCELCAAGRFSNMTGLVECYECAKGTSQPGTGGAQCELCDQGRFANTTGADVCELCPEGKVTAARGATECEACAPGTVERENRKLCLACSVGSASTDPADDCELCPAGRFSNVTGSVECFECAAGTSQPAAGSGQCELCDQGRFVNSTGAEVCDLCPKGKVTAARGATECEACAPGTVERENRLCLQCPVGSSSSDPSVECAPCAAGRYAPIAGSSECTACEPGKAQSQVFGFQCLDCALGRFANVSGLASCLDCPSGKVTNDTASTQCSSCSAGEVVRDLACEACEPGRYAPLGASACLPCAPGSFAGSAGASACDACPAGSSSARFGRTECTLCIPGFFSNSTGSTECASCPAGTISSNVGSESCVLCPLGSISRNAGTLCLQCPSGQFSDDPTASTCDACPVGTSTRLAGSSVCAQCEAGKFAEREASTSCIDCVPGKVTNRTGQAECTDCPLNFVATTVAQAVCSECPKTQFTRATSSSRCVPCPDDQYVVFASDPDPASPERVFVACKPCPAGARCVDGRVVADSGVWVVRRPDGSVEAQVCLPGRCESCRPSSDEGDDAGLSTCCSGNREPPESNPMCARCAEGYTEWGNECIECEGTNVPLLLMLMLVLWGVVVLLHRFVYQEANGMAVVFFYYVQMALLGFGEETEWLAWASFLNFNPMQSTGGTCVADWSPVTKLTVNVLTPALTWLFLGATAAVHAFVTVCKRRVPGADNAEGVNWRSFRVPYLRSSLAFFLFTYNNLANGSLRFFECVEVGGRWTVLRSAPEVDCESDEYQTVKPIFVVCLVAVALGPLVLFYWLRRVAQGQQDERKHDVYKVLFEIFKGKPGSIQYYWNVVVLVRRVAIVAVSVIFARFGSSTRYAALTIAHLAVLLGHLHTRPFKKMQFSGAYVEHARDLAHGAVRIIPINHIETVSLALLVAYTATTTAMTLPLTDEQGGAYAAIVIGWLVVLLGVMVARVVGKARAKRHSTRAARRQRKPSRPVAVLFDGGEDELDPLGEHALDVSSSMPTSLELSRLGE